MMLISSAIMSATEVAFFSLSPAEIKDLSTSQRKEDIRIHKLVRDPGKLLASILIANNLFNVTTVILSTVIIGGLQQQFQWNQSSRFILEVFAVTFIILLFGEITPKIFASRKQLETARVFSGLVSLMCKVLYPISTVLTRSTRFISRPVSQETESLSRQDLRHAIDLTSDKESPEEEKDILKGIVNFSSIAVRNIFHARVDLKAVEIHTPFSELIDTINKYGYSRIPVYEENLDHIRGILYVKDLLALLNESGEHAWQSLIRPAYFVPESKKISDLLDEFKEKRLHIAIVVDEYGGTSGIVTLEDVLEEIFGEINDEFDTEAPDWTKVSDTEFVLEGKILLNDLIRIADLPEEIFDTLRGENDSLAGLILEINGTFPEAGFILEVEHLKFVIDTVTPRRIKKVRMFIQQDDEKE